ncbi:MAG: anaerobic ribonucleoside-triphosphate reductase activating protein [Candidatus Nealsonbacteria bacterium]|nr:anaerobic ribonucleoside-triphosphate reductase activating protein [Candidatus Nealsonbacteria bacterium]
MTLGGLQKTTLIDFPGRVACTVFLLGCNFRCPFCYSAELVLPEKVKNQPRISEKEFFDFLKERKGLLEGVVICGGEPTFNRELPDFIGKIKKAGFLVKLDTNGSNPEMLKELIASKMVDYFAMDIKAPFSPKYKEVTGGDDLEKIRESARLIKNSGVDYEFRTTVVPGIHVKEDILQIAKDISPAKRYYLQNFRPEKTLDPEMEKVKPYSNEFLLEIQKAISPFFEICRVR